jgi:hypothetical protein
MEDIESGEYGDKVYFKPLVDSVNNMKVGNDWFLLANDFASYLDVQKKVRPAPRSRWSTRQKQESDRAPRARHCLWCAWNGVLSHRGVGIL